MLQYIKIVYSDNFVMYKNNTVHKIQKMGMIKELDSGYRMHCNDSHKHNVISVRIRNAETESQGMCTDLQRESLYELWLFSILGCLGVCSWPVYLHICVFISIFLGCLGQYLSIWMGRKGLSTSVTCVFTCLPESGCWSQYLALCVFFLFFVGFFSVFHDFIFSLQPFIFSAFYMILFAVCLFELCIWVYLCVWEWSVLYLHLCVHVFPCVCLCVYVHASRSGCVCTGFWV